MKKMITGISLILALIFTLQSCAKQCEEIGYTGKNCDVQLKPRSITFDYATMRVYPMRTAAGYTWDVSTGGATSNPDVFIEIVDPETGDAVWKSEVLQNASGSTYSFRMNPPTFSAILESQQYTVNIWDYDDSVLDASSDLMSTGKFVLYDRLNKFPQTITPNIPSVSLQLQQLSYTY